MKNPFLAIFLWVLLPVGVITFIASHYPSAIERRAMANKARGKAIQFPPKTISTELQIILPSGRRLKAEEFSLETRARELEL